MRTETEIREMIAEIVEQRNTTIKGTTSWRTLNERVKALDWAMRPGLPTLVLNKTAVNILNGLY